jgi:RNA polymerase sigma factor (TIGR02999 family)
MPEDSVTSLLVAHRAGQVGALDKAFGIVYDELRRLARFQLQSQGKGRTLDTTSLVHEVYLKVSTSEHADADNRGHFLALASRAMRQIVIDYARAQTAAKRGGNAQRVPLDTNVMAVEDEAHWILTIEEVLREVGEIDPRLEAVFECRYFAGLSEDETATALNLSLRTVQRDWQRAKGWMREYLGER